MGLISSITTTSVTVSLTLFATSSMADTVSASASVSNLHYQLIDLNPNDGIAASISFAGSVNQSATEVFDASKGVQRDTQTTHDISSIYSNIVLGDGQASAGFSAASTSGSFGDFYTKGYQSGVGSFSADSGMNATFTLSANTVLVFYGNIGGHASGPAPWDQNHQASSHASFGFYGPTLPNNGGTQYAAINRDWNTYYGATGSFENFTLSFVNGQQQATTGYLWASMKSTGTNVNAAPVPEPETWGMLLAGLALTGAVARRRNNARRIG